MMMVNGLSQQPQKSDPSRETLSLKSVALQLQETRISECQVQSYSEESSDVQQTEFNQGTYTQTACVLLPQGHVDSRLKKNIAPSVNYYDMKENRSKCSRIPPGFEKLPVDQDVSKILPTMTGKPFTANRQAESAPRELQCISSFGKTLCRPNGPNKVNLRRRKKPSRFSYCRQLSAASSRNLFRPIHSCPPDVSQTQIITPFDFSTPSPDDVVKVRQKNAFNN